MFAREDGSVSGGPVSTSVEATTRHDIVRLPDRSAAATDERATAAADRQVAGHHRVAAIGIPGQYAECRGDLQCDIPASAVQLRPSNRCRRSAIERACDCRARFRQSSSPCVLKGYQRFANPYSPETQRREGFLPSKHGIC